MRSLVSYHLDSFFLFNIPPPKNVKIEILKYIQFSAKNVTGDSVKSKMEFTIIMRYFFLVEGLWGVSETEKTVDRVSIMELVRDLLRCRNENP
jgi:hypothetical protein